MIPFLFDVAAIPVFDWNGPEFLSFYLVSLIAAIWWSLRRSKKALDRFNRPGEPAAPTDPYELAAMVTVDVDSFYLADPRARQHAFATFGV